MWKLKRETKARWACKKIISTGQKENFHLFGFFFKIPSVVPSLVFRFMNKKSILAVKYRSYFFEGGHSISPVDLKFKSAFRSPIKTPPCASVCQRGFGENTECGQALLCVVGHGWPVMRLLGWAAVGVLGNVNCCALPGGLELGRDQVFSAELLWRMKSVSRMERVAIV